MNPIEISCRHLERMTDDTGLLEHALGAVPRRKEGYTTDDNARALWACSVIHRLGFGGEKNDGTWLRLADIYLEFLLWAQKDDGTFHNNIAYDRRPEPETPSDDCYGRAFWAAAAAWAYLRDDTRRLAAEAILLRAAPRTAELKYPRGWAYSLAAYSLLLTEQRPPVQMDRAGFLKKLQAREQVNRLERLLLDTYSREATVDWHWFEPEVTYGNGVLPWALFAAYPASGSETTRRVARESLDFLAEKMTAPEGWIRPVGNRGWASRTHASQWDQQPLEVMKLALAAREAYRVERRSEDAELVRRCRAWFLGENDLGRPLADPAEGSCCDGLTPSGPNQNRGAESTLSYLLTECLYHEICAEGMTGSDSEREGEGNAETAKRAERAVTEERAITAKTAETGESAVTEAIG